ncbi:UTRA domain-containing protein [Streptomyces alkaliphilus]|uniref:UTRA domain-containing protein n=1 Tax=Streptomyces alkaliphilus TaxID=1472722 RepID=A0A7W3TBW1_9ACTN|nr:UTRA domain-containing protein [Streptomyces alkaliphilus]MBB0244019.1 UTRA domain-containing protein [Streptomyces alkaliphilus]
MTKELWETDSTVYLTPRPGGSDARAEEAAARGGRGTQRLVEVRRIRAPETVAGPLGLAPDAEVGVRRRVMYLDDRPVELTASHYPVDIAAGTALAEPRRIPGGAVTLLADLGFRPHEVEETVAVDLPEPAVREALALGEGEPVMLLTRVSRAADGRPFEVGVMTMVRGGRLRYRTRMG